MDIAILIVGFLGLGTLANFLIQGMRSSLTTDLKNKLATDVKAGMDGVRDEINTSGTALRQEVLGQFTQLGEANDKRMEGYGKKIDEVTEKNEARLTKIEGDIKTQLDSIRGENSKKLDEMRTTVEEKLDKTLGDRLGASFNLVSSQLKEVNLGLGEMKNLATDVGSLKKVLTNVRTRGIWGEIQLGSLLEQILSQGQYEANVKVKPDSAERVEFAIKFPGPDEDSTRWLSMDSKFPQESYEALLSAEESGDAEQIAAANKRLEQDIKVQAKFIRDKYIAPPYTADFAVMYLPIEGLYAEVVKRVSLADYLRLECNVVVAGPNTVTAMLNTFQMVFRTVAIQKKAGEVWGVLSKVKSEFGKFGGLLGRVDDQLGTVSKTLGIVRGKTTTINRDLKNVEELPGITLSEEVPDLDPEILLPQTAELDEETNIEDIPF